MALALNGVTTEYTLPGLNTPVQLASVSPNAAVHSITLFNKDGTATVYVGWGTGGVGVSPGGTGIPIPPGGNLIFGAYDASRLPGGDFYATTSGINTKISFTIFYT